LELRDKAVVEALGVERSHNRWLRLVADCEKHVRSMREAIERSKTCLADDPQTDDRLIFAWGSKSPAGTRTGDFLTGKKIFVFQQGIGTQEMVCI